MFNNLRELITTMPDEKNCREFLADQRWHGNVVCPHCDCAKTYVIEGGKRYKCANSECYKKFSVTTGTIFHASNIPITKWFMAIYITTAHKKGISTYQLAKDIGTSQKTAWFMIHRIREVLRDTNAELIKGTVEIDETYIGGKMKNKNKRLRKANAENQQSSTLNKVGVMGMLERKEGIKMQVMDENKPFKEIVKQNVSFSSTVITDNAAFYKGLDKSYKAHEIVNHIEDEFVRGQWHTNSVEGAFGLFKRMIIGIYHQVSPKHLSRYCDEFTYRYNSRKLKDADRFLITLQRIERRLTYKNLVYNGKSSQENKNSQAKKI